MKWQRSIVQTFFFAMFITVLATGLIVGGFWFMQSQTFYKSEIEHLKDDYLHMQKVTLEHEVSAVIEELDFHTEHAQDRLRADVKERVYEAYDLGISLYERYKNEKTPDEIQTLIINALREIRFNKGRGYYFIDTLDGDVILFPVSPQLEGSNILNLEDRLGNRVIQEEINTIQQSNEGFVEGFWQKPNGNPNENYLKISFVKSFEPFGWYIGTGEYLEDVMLDIKEDVFLKYTQYRFGEHDENYVFISSWEGDELVNGMYPEFVGQNLWSLKDKDGRAVVREEIEMARQNPEGTFLQHFWKQPNADEEIEKLTFVRAFPQWEIIVGSGVSIESIEQSIEPQKEEINRGTWKRMLNIIVIVIIILIVIGGFIKYLENATLKSFNTFYVFFEKAVREKKPIEKDELNFKEFKLLADSANQMLNEQNNADQKLRELNENLEQMVKGRTSELEASLKKLSETQNLLIENERLALIGGLVSGLTHELDNPLGITLSLVSNVERLTQDFMENLKIGSLKKSELDEYLIDIAEELHLSLSNLRKTIEVVEHFRHIAVNQSSGEKRHFNIKEHIENQIHSLQQKFQRPHIRVNLICEEDVDIYSNPSDYAQVLDHLFVNAFIHGFDYDETGEITVEVMHNESRLLILFKDSGKGIEEEDLQRIFEPFFTTLKEEGKSGLGLNIVYDIVTNKLDGNLNVSSQLGFGTEYDIEIPLEEME